MEKFDQYDKSVELFEKYSKLEDITDTDEVISAYSLYTMLQNEMSPIYDICHNEKFEKKACRAYMKKNPKQFFNILTSEGKKCEITPVLESFANRIGIKFCFADWDRRVVYKPFDSDHYYFYDYPEDDYKPVDKEVIEQCSEDITYTFDVLDRYVPLFKKAGCCRRDDFEFSFEEDFEGKISYEADGRVSYSLGAYGASDTYNHWHWYGEREPLQELFDQHSEMLLKRIPIDVQTLCGLFKAVYEKNKEDKKVYHK